VGSPARGPASGLALSFFTWRTLVREGGLEQADAVDMMIHAVDAPTGP
jgi:hypothetical protein